MRDAACSTGAAACRAGSGWAGGRDLEAGRAGGRGAAVLEKATERVGEQRLVRREEVRAAVALAVRPLLRTRGARARGL